MFSNASNEPIQRPDETVILRKVPGSTFEVCASDDSPGIQVADLALWLYRQAIAGKSIPEGSTAILEYVFKKGSWRDFSFGGVGEQLNRQLRDLMEWEIPPEAIEAGRRFQEEQEQRRHHLIAKYEEDGLMPYQRHSIEPVLTGSVRPDRQEKA